MPCFQSKREVFISSFTSVSSFLLSAAHKLRVVMFFHAQTQKSLGSVKYFFNKTDCDLLLNYAIAFGSVLTLFCLIVSDERGYLTLHYQSVSPDKIANGVWLLKYLFSIYCFIFGCAWVFIAARGLSCCGARGSKGSAAVVLRGMWGPLLGSGLNPCPLHWQQILSHWLPRKVLEYFLNLPTKELDLAYSKERHMNHGSLETWLHSRTEAGKSLSWVWAS